MAPPPVLQLENIRYRAGRCEILRGIDWTIRPGEHWTLLGRNGSGKTTLLRVIAGYVWPQSGAVRVLGNLYGETDLPNLRKRIGWVTSFLKRQLRGWETALEVVLSGYEASIGVYRDFTDGEISHARALMARLGCEHLADKEFEILSQGERQRLLLARGLVHSPDLLILDEPCSGLDPLATRNFLADLQSIAAQPHAPTILYVTHHLGEIAPFLNKTLLLSQGRTLAAGDTPAVLTSGNLSHTFGCSCDIRREGSRYHLLWRDEE
jgi:iron complex transport system ATP-binding protein